MSTTHVNHNDGRVRATVGVIGGSGFYRSSTDPERGRRRDAVRRRRLHRSRSARSGAARSRSCRATARARASRRTGSTTGPTCGRCARSACARCWRRAPWGLRPELGAGTLVVPDQLVDRTTGRVQTFFDSGACTSPSPTRTARGCARHLSAPREPGRSSTAAPWS